MLFFAEQTHKKTRFVNLMDFGSKIKTPASVESGGKLFLDFLIQIAGDSAVVLTCGISG